jgi:hypothetical protein
VATRPIKTELLASAREIGWLTDMMRQLLDHRASAVQGAVLADLTAMWLARHAEERRGELLRNYLQTVHQLTPINARMLRPHRAA